MVLTNVIENEAFAICILYFGCYILDILYVSQFSRLRLKKGRPTCYLLYSPL